MDSLSSHSSHTRNAVYKDISSFRSASIDMQTTVQNRQSWETSVRSTEDSLTARWNEALEKCRLRLEEKDFEKALEFDSPEKLWDDLDKRAQEARDHPRNNQRLRNAVELTNSSLREIIAHFIALMMPSSLTAGVLLGTFHLTIYLMGRLKPSDKPDWQQLTHIINNIRRQLAWLNNNIKAVMDEQPNEVKIAIVESFEALIDLWVTASLSLSKQRKLDQVLDKAFEKTMDQFHAANDLLTKLKPLSLGRIVDADNSISTNAKDTPENCAFPIHLLPASRTTVFIGRSLDLIAIENYFSGKNLSRSGEPLRIFSIWGLGGVGKTELALSFASRHRSDFDAIFWIFGDSVKSLQHAFTQIAMDLDLPGAQKTGDNETHEFNLGLVKKWLRITHRKCLLIFDNVEKYKHLATFLPLGCHASVLVTTRYKAVAIGPKQGTAHLKPFNDEQGRIDAQFLFERLLEWEEDRVVEAAEREAELKILKYMDGLVLGIQQMASLILHRNQEDHLDDFLKDYEQYPHESHRLDTEEIDRHTLETLWQMTFHELAVGEFKNSATILGVLSCISPDAIRIDLFRLQQVPDLPENLAFCGAKIAVDKAIDKLQALNLLERNNQTLSLHRLVQSGFLYDVNCDRQCSFNNAAFMLNHTFPKQIKGKWMFGDWAKCQSNVEHVQALIKTYQDLNLQEYTVESCEDFTELLTNYAWYMDETDNYWIVLELMEVAKSICREKNSLWYAHLLNTEAMSYFSLNKLRKSEELLLESKAIRESLLLENDEELGNTYNNLGIVASGQGRLDEALCYLRKARVTRADVRETETSVATTLINIGRALYLKRDYVNAEKALERARDLCERNFGKETFPTQGIYFTLGNLYLAMNELWKARLSYLTSRDIVRKVNNEHIYLASIDYKIGSVNLMLKEYPASLLALNQGLRIALQRLPDTKGEQARILRKKAILIETVHKLSEYEKQALEPAISLGEFGTLSEAEQMRGEAEALRKEILEDEYIPVVEDEEEAYGKLIYPFKR